MLYYKNDCREGESKMEGKTKGFLIKTLFRYLNKSRLISFKQEGKFYQMQTRSCYPCISGLVKLLPKILNMEIIL